MAEQGRLKTVPGLQQGRSCTVRWEQIKAGTWPSGSNLAFEYLSGPAEPRVPSGSLQAQCFVQIDAGSAAHMPADMQCR